jgi:hypothetical protein
MEMQILPPPARLRGQVRALWVLRGRPVGRYQGLPKPYAELIVSLAGSHCWYSEPGAAGVRFEEGWLTPLQAAPRYAETAGELHLVGARLEPAACAQLFGVAVQRGWGIRSRWRRCWVVRLGGCASSCPRPRRREGGWRRWRGGSATT